MTIVDTIADEHYGDKVKLAMAFAGLLNQEARALEKDGVDVIQFDEPAFNVYMDDVKRWGIDALHRAIEGLKCTTCVHICYGYGIQANIDWKKTLGGEWRQYEEIFPALARSRIDQISLECIHSKVPIELLRLLKGKDVLVGVIDVANDKVETPQEVASVIERALKYVPAKHFFACTNCGMAPMDRDVAAAKLRALVDGAALARLRVYQAKAKAGKHSDFEPRGSQPASSAPLASSSCAPETKPSVQSGATSMSWPRRRSSSITFEPKRGSMRTRLGSPWCGEKNPGKCSVDRRGASIASCSDMPNAARYRKNCSSHWPWLSPPMVPKVIHGLPPLKASEGVSVVRGRLPGATTFGMVRGREIERHHARRQREAERPDHLGRLDPRAAGRERSHVALRVDRVDMHRARAPVLRREALVLRQQRGVAPRVAGPQARGCFCACR